MKRGKRWLGGAAWCLLVMAGVCLVWCAPLKAQEEKIQEACILAHGQNEAALPSYQDYADLIAGNTREAASLAEWVTPEGWFEYVEDMKQTWERFEQKRLKPMRDWATQELGTAQNGEATVFYPFSGPDVANVLALFPQAKNYLLIALEPVGSLPILQPGTNGPFYSSLQQSLSELLRLNYFITKMMACDLKKRELDGVLPVLFYFLGREKVSILEAKHWQMQPDGNITEEPVKGGEKPNGSPGIPGLRIIFQRGEGEPQQTLYYFRFNLEDDSWRSNPQFVRFLKGFAPFQSFVKAASYLMFNPQFGNIRQFILDQSRMVLQTDEGIPLRYFEPAKWDRRFYGKYSCPIQVFAKCFQADMATIYRKALKAKPLPFVVGYHATPNSANLLLASRRPIVAVEEAQ